MEKVIVSRIFPRVGGVCGRVCFAGGWEPWAVCLSNRRRFLSWLLKKQAYPVNHWLSELVSSFIFSNIVINPLIFPWVSIIWGLFFFFNTACPFWIPSNWLLCPFELIHNFWWLPFFLVQEHVPGIFCILSVPDLVSGIFLMSHGS